MSTEETVVIEVVKMDFRLQNPTVDDKTKTIGKLNFSQREGNGASVTMQRPLQSAVKVKFGLNLKI